MKRIGRRTRERAALICQVAASNGVWNYISAASVVGIDMFDHAIDVACWAYAASYMARRRRTDCDAEAEALLRSGWSGGPIERRRR